VTTPDTDNECSATEYLLASTVKITCSKTTLATATATHLDVETSTTNDLLLKLQQLQI